MKAKRFLLILICIGMILGGLVSCADKTDDDDDREKPVYDDSSRENVSDSIPDDYSLEDQKVGIFYSDHIREEVIGEEEAEDIVYTRIYERNLKVEWRLDCDLVFIPGGKYTDWQVFSREVRPAVMQMDDSFWIVTSTNNTIIQEKNFDLFHNLNDSLYIDIEREWWYKDAILECAVDGYYYRLMYGDVCLSAMGNNGAIYYNKEYYGTYIDPGNPEGIYEYVLNGTWTLDKFAGIVAESHIDYGGENDIHGFTLVRYAEPLHYFPISCGIEFYKRDSTGYPTVTVNNEKSKDFAVKLYDLLYNNAGTTLLYFPNKVTENVGQPMFTDGKFMFNLGSLGNMLTPEMRAMTYDFGVLPYPKWENEQEEYITMNANGATLIGCTINNPISIANDEAGAVIEALCSEAYRSVSLAFYEDALQGAYSRDDMTSRMIDIICGRDDEIKSRVTKNFLYEYNSTIGGIGSIFQKIMAKGKIGTPVFSSTYGELSNFEQKIEELYNEYVKAATDY